MKKLFYLNNAPISRPWWNDMKLPKNKSVQTQPMPGHNMDDIDLEDLSFKARKWKNRNMGELA